MAKVRVAVPEKLSIWDAQKTARDFVLKHIREKPLGLPEMDEEPFGVVMDAIVRAMTAAWADGYYTGRP